MVVTVLGGAVDGIDGYEVAVEVDAGRGLPSFQIVGLPNAAVRESRERVMAALRNSGLEWPKGRVVVNLAPAEVRKEGASLDLAVAVGIGRQQDGVARADVVDAVFLGELSLSGHLRPVRGLSAVVRRLVAHGRTRFVVPAEQAGEAALTPGVRVAGAAHLGDIAAWLRGEERLAWREGGAEPWGPTPADPERTTALLAGVAPEDRRLAAAAAAGRHNLLLVGPPGGGKTRLARTVAALQPPPARDEALEILRIHGAAVVGDPRPEAAGPPAYPARPFRAPHHTVTRAGLIGGGAALRPGEATLAHHGVLFLDEVTEYAPGVLDALREPMEERVVRVARAAGTRVWPADVQLLAAMNPCRCGWLGSDRRECRCPEAVVERHRARLSGPFLDRIDCFAEIASARVRIAAAAAAVDEDCRALAAALIEAAPRLHARPPASTALAALKPWLDPEAAAVLDETRTALGATVRGLIRCGWVARTLAALDRRDRAGRGQVLEALQWRRETVLPTKEGAV